MHREIMLPNGDKKDISGVDSNYGYETKTMKNEKDNEKWINEMNNKEWTCLKFYAAPIGYHRSPASYYSI